MKKKALFSALLALLITSIWFYKPVAAQVGSANDSLSLVAMPPRAGDEGQLRVAPGKTIQTTVRVRNASNQPVVLNSYALDFIVKEDGRTPIAVQETVTNRWSLAKWITIVPNQHTLQPKETAEMAVVIEVPEDAMPGGHYAMILHEPTNQADVSEQSGSGTGVTQRIGTLLYVIVEGEISEQANLREFQFKKFQEFGPVPYSFLIRNQSDIHIRPRISIDIFNMLGRKSGSIEVDPQNIFPLNSRTYAGKWDKIWGFGLYTAKLTASYGETGQVIVDSTSFWIIPIRIILSIIIGTLLIVVLILAIKRHAEKKYQLEQEKVKELQMKLDSVDDKKQSVVKQSK